MLKKLRQHWKVNNADLFIILCTFAIAGTATAFISKKITYWLNVPHYSFGWWALKIAVLLIGYQVIILTTGWVFGKFSFFWDYEKKILRRLGLLKKQIPAEASPAHQTDPVIKLAIFASGKGSNAKRIIDHFHHTRSAAVDLILTDQPGAGVLTLAATAGVKTIILDKTRFFKGDAYLPELEAAGINLIVLAGFMRKIPDALVRAFPNKILNIHPALLPKYGGKGMFGSHVHRAVLENKENESGITIHFVDEIYDHGEIIFQEKCSVSPGENEISLAEKVQALEHRFFPLIIEKVLLGEEPRKKN